METTSSFCCRGGGFGFSTRVEEEVQRKGDHSLIGKVCGDRVVGKDLISSMMGKIWRISKKAVFQEVEKNIFVVTFATHADKDRILDEHLWLFDNMLFPLRPYDGRLQSAQIKFESKVFWVQMHNLPLGMMTKERGEQIGGSVGKVLEVDVEEDGIGWGRFLQVEIELPLFKPIARGKFINSSAGSYGCPFNMKNFPKFALGVGGLLTMVLAARWVK